MTAERCLFERIINAETVNQRTLAFDEHKLQKSILSHVQDMLNVRQGSVMALPDYGMPDFNDLVSQFPDAIIQIKQAIKEYLSLYEPRLSTIRVEHYEDADNPLVLKFGITAEVVTENQRSRISFETELAGSGQARVKG
ncbi:type VI secretion system baseplate subunit TssE [Zooshikella harenae]|uniref:Type VI secretion system baseplate subunit TssE n=1 Tax=Zooshikella harenae TaxID=2827238 RepID=A0ABS5Z947_9GAMM|nr:type VI secretion system baseplate subunit TssE [Zooshikella harenae]MBU2710570.1 type VI secretion system baseplate subunit TssE [Zooshikella harenae]